MTTWNGGDRGGCLGGRYGRGHGADQLPESLDWVGFAGDVDAVLRHPVQCTDQPAAARADPDRDRAAAARPAHHLDGRMGKDSVESAARHRSAHGHRAIEKLSLAIKGWPSRAGATRPDTKALTDSSCFMAGRSAQRQWLCFLQEAVDDLPSTGREGV
jgi:hypothetical protein